MATFSTNQTRHLYVAKKEITGTALPAEMGDFKVVKKDKDLYFQYMSPAGLVRSDLINTDNIIAKTKTAASAMERALKEVTLTLNAKVNGGAPISGQDYIARIAFRQYIGMSDEDTYVKYGMVHAYANMTASEFYKELAKSLVKNFSREAAPLVTFALKTADTSVEVNTATNWASLEGEYTGVVITEALQPWVLGVAEQLPVCFDVYPTTITVDGDEVIWGETKVGESAVVVNNGKRIADLEYFCMKERGDQYGNMGWPKVIPTTYMVNPDEAYDVIDIHYAYAGDGHSVQKSEKDITIVGSSSVINSIYSKL